MILFGWKSDRRSKCPGSNHPKAYERQSAQYSCEMTDEEWAIIVAFCRHNRLAAAAKLSWAKLSGNFELGKVAFHKIELGDVWDAIQYSVASGCA